MDYLALRYAMERRRKRRRGSDVVMCCGAGCDDGADGPDNTFSINVVLLWIFIITLSV